MAVKKDLRSLFIHELKDIYNAENQIVKALPSMIDAAASVELSQALSEHLAITEGQILRLDKIFETLGESARGKKCKGMEGLLEEGKDLLAEDAEPDVLDAGIIGAAQKVEHYEIAAYGTLCAFARQLGEDRVEKLLMLSLKEEKEADRTLTEIAEAAVNAEAVA